MRLSRALGVESRKLMHIPPLGEEAWGVTRTPSSFDEAAALYRAAGRHGPRRRNSQIAEDLSLSNLGRRR